MWRVVRDEVGSQGQGEPVAYVECCDVKVAFPL